MSQEIDQEHLAACKRAQQLGFITHIKSAGHTADETRRLTKRYQALDSQREKNACAVRDAVLPQAK